MSDTTEQAMARRARGVEDLPMFSAKLSERDTPPLARASDPATSHDGAEAIRPKLKGLKALVRDIYAAHPAGLTPKEAQAIANREGLWKRTSDAKRDGWLVPTGEVRDGGEVLRLLDKR